ncbi:MAG TPA: DUF333 domain-containing protein [archaeon]|nr:DUF333 domain-containing protein [archaeon]
MKGVLIAIIAIVVVVVLALVLTGTNSTENGVACTQDAKLCADGSYVARVPPTCEFASCPATTDGRIACTPEQRNAQVCPEIYGPVCGWFDSNIIMCIKYPCAAEYENGCRACADNKVEYYTSGACPSENAQIANPASTNCIEKGGMLEILDSPEGQYGMCTLPNGTVCEEWALFRGECS